MLTKVNIVKLICFGISIMAFSEIGKAQKTADEKTCNVWQVCESNKDATPDNPPDAPCADASKVTIPVFWPGNYAPAKMPERGMNDFKTACPFYTDPD